MTSLRRPWTERPGAGGAERRPAVWRGGGVVYLAACLAGLAVGLFPQVVYVPKSGVPPQSTPALQCLALAQLAFLLLAYPLLALRRAGGASPVPTLPESPDRVGAVRSHAGETCPREDAQRATLPPRCSLRTDVLETLVLLAAAAPFYVLAAWFADATARDVVRTVLTVAAFLPLAWGAAGWMRAWPSLRPLPLTLLALAVLGLPALWYVSAEFFAGTAAADAIWSLAPLTRTWTNAASRLGPWVPGPAWSVLVWIVVGALLVFTARTTGGRSRDAG